ncbi:MAG: hypothetical protein OWR62_14360 [Sulfobacillus thermotolerans]|nr:hypothetical protein [Sulfobacillus thermotolerans]
MSTATKGVLWVIGALVVIVGSFYATSAVHVARLSRRYGQAYLNPELGGAAQYKINVWVPSGNGTSQYVVLYDANKFKTVSVPETGAAHWATLGVFPSQDNATMSVRRVGEGGQRNDGVVGGHIQHQQVEFIPVAS